MKKFGIIGGGSWATALVKILTDNLKEKEISWWLRDSKTVNHIIQFRHNPNYLTAVDIDPGRVFISNRLEEVVAASEILILVVPSAFLEEVLASIPPENFEGKIFVSAVKGVVPRTHQIVGEFVKSQFKVPLSSIGVITGPCHAEEISAEKLSYLTIASENRALVDEISANISGRYVRSIPSDDIFGTEYSAVLKNVYALAAGICHGMGYGDNFQAVLMSNAIREIKRFIALAHPISRDIDDTAYLGDLLVTGYSQYSRNRTFGHMIGKGYSAKSAQLEMNMIAEGFYATKSMFEINKNVGAKMPILKFVYAILYGLVSPADAAPELEENLQ